MQSTTSLVQCILSTFARWYCMYFSTFFTPAISILAPNSIVSSQNHDGSVLHVSQVILLSHKHDDVNNKKLNCRREAARLCPTACKKEGKLSSESVRGEYVRGGFPDSNMTNLDMLIAEVRSQTRRRSTEPSASLISSQGIVIFVITIILIIILSISSRA